MSLEDELERRRRKVAATLQEPDLRTIDGSIMRLQMLQLAENSLQVGDVLPDLALHGADGETVSGEDLLARAPLVLCFFRGTWCPYCDATFRAMEAARPEIESVGGLLLGICPDRPEELRRTISDLGIGYPLLSDPHSRFARLCGLRWELGDDHVAFFDRIGVDLPARHGSHEWALPMPATYVVDGDGVIRFVFASADWRYRVEPGDIVALLRRMAQAPA